MHWSCSCSSRPQHQAPPLLIMHNSITHSPSLLPSARPPPVPPTHHQSGCACLRDRVIAFRGGAGALHTELPSSPSGRCTLSGRLVAGADRGPATSPASSGSLAQPGRAGHAGAAGPAGARPRGAAAAGSSVCQLPRGHPRGAGRHPPPPLGPSSGPGERSTPGVVEHHSRSLPMCLAVVGRGCSISLAGLAEKAVHPVTVLSRA